MEFGRVIAGALRYVVEYRKVLSKALLIPFIAYLALDATKLLEFNLALSILVLVVGLAVQTVFAITTHRVILLGPQSISPWGITKWSKRETFFAFYLIGLGLLIIPIAVLGLVPILGGIVAVLIMCWLAGRLSLVFPGIAVDKGVTFGLSWQLTQNHQLLMFLVVAIVPLLLAIPVVLLSFIPHTFFFMSVISTFVIVFEVAALSVAYRLITQQIYDQD